MLSAEELLGEEGIAAGALAESCRYAVANSGKQLRPRLVIEASRVGHGESPNVRKAARAVELLHIATLAHDDVIDDSPLRRGAASLDGKHGGFAAGYAGAWLFGTAVELAAECGQLAVGLLAGAACELCDGEMVETQDLYNTARPVERYLDAVSGKTASLFELSAGLGGLTGGAPATACQALARYGQLLGMAFQLSDDILDLLGDWKGRKRRGGDLLHGVFTLPVIYAMQSDPALREDLGGVIEEATVDSLIGRVRATGAFVRALEACDSYADQAREIARVLQAPWLHAFVDAALEPLDPVRAL